MATDPTGQPDQQAAALPDPRPLTRRLWEHHYGMNPGAGTCQGCGTQFIATEDNTSWTAAAAAFQRHLWDVLAEPLATHARRNPFEAPSEPQSAPAATVGAVGAPSA